MGFEFCTIEIGLFHLYFPIFTVCVQWREYGGFSEWVDAFLYVWDGIRFSICYCDWLKVNLQNRKVSSYFGTKTIGEAHSICTDWMMLSARISLILIPSNSQVFDSASSEGERNVGMFVYFNSMRYYVILIHPRWPSHMDSKSYSM